ncbi:MAG TPA: amidohydrolase family protein [Saprospiraceae bacterium]|nr:amidohydrolase family protein [Saprospiraceae bacterium]HPN71935.1 amidohydrolase family protein [Saprospiraceae bacterium]
MDIKIIDSHQHFWKYEPVKHDWIDEDMKVIRRDFYPADLSEVYNENQVMGCVAVQADQIEEETLFLLKIARENDFVKGVVGWVDLRSPKISERLDYFAQFTEIKGFRHVLQGEHPDFMLQDAFLNGIGSLKDFDFTYDILIFPQHLENSIKLAKQFPDQKFVVDHIAKPFIKMGEIVDWQRNMEELGKLENVSCKISGMITEADYDHWTYEQLLPYLDVVLNAFGIQKVMFGSDWPVCLVAGKYEQVLGIVNKYFDTFTSAEKSAFFAENATAFYNL